MQRVVHNTAHPNHSGTVGHLHPASRRRWGSDSIDTCGHRNINRWSPLLHIQLEVQRCNAQLTADGFRLMVNARYSEAAEHFTRALDSEHATSRCRRNWTRMLALARVFASMEGVGPHADSADAALYFRGECCVFDVSAAEQLYVDECAAESGHRGIERDRRSIEFSKA